MGLGNVKSQHVWDGEEGVSFDFHIISTMSLIETQIRSYNLRSVIWGECSRLGEHCTKTTKLLQHFLYLNAGLN